MIYDRILNLIQTGVRIYMTKVSKRNQEEELDKLFSKGFIDSFGPVLHMEFFVDLVNMYTYCTGGNAQLLSDLFIQ